MKFGPGGAGKEFPRDKYKNYEIPVWIAENNLEAFEYQMNRGINIKEDDAKRFGRNAEEYNIFITVHAPYYINLLSKEKLQSSVKLLVRTCYLAQLMNAERVVFHPGWYLKGIPKEKQVKIFEENLKVVLFELKKRNIEIILSPETMGKLPQFGDLDELLRVSSEKVILTIDFGHLHARYIAYQPTLFELKVRKPKGFFKEEDYEYVFEKLKRFEKESGIKILSNLHIHFSVVEACKYGEKRHWTLDEEKKFGPYFDPLVKALKRYNCNGTIICESKDRMIEDAKRLKDRFYLFKTFSENNQKKQSGSLFHRSIDKTSTALCRFRL